MTADAGNASLFYIGHVWTALLLNAGVTSAVVSTSHAFLSYLVKPPFAKMLNAK